MSERVILVNPNAHGGRGRARWERVREAIAARFPHQAIETASEADAQARAREAAAAGARVIASASGDGGVNALINALMDPATDAMRYEVAVGAVGLGSSNDFHKPRDPSREVMRVPVALDAGTTQRVDLGRADWRTPSGETGSRYFVLNASLGATAKGNLRFNQATGLLAWLKEHQTDLAIQYGTLEAIARFANVPAALTIDGVSQGLVDIANLGVIKRQYFVGGMRYDTPVTPDDGHFDVNLCHDMSRLEFIKAVMAISNGHFLGLPKTQHWRAREVRLVPSAPTALELDGEVVEAAEVALRVVPRAITLCR